MGEAARCAGFPGVAVSRRSTAGKCTPRCSDCRTRRVIGNCHSAFVEQKKAMQRGLGGSPHERLHQEAIASLD